MKPTTLLASILGLALTAVAAPAALERRWCYPLCCCGDQCFVDEVCNSDKEALGYLTYCCNDFLTTDDPIEVTQDYLDGHCYLKPDLPEEVPIPI